MPTLFAHSSKKSVGLSSWKRCFFSWLPSLLSEPARDDCLVDGTFMSRSIDECTFVRYMVFTGCDCTKVKPWCRFMRRLPLSDETVRFVSLSTTWLIEPRPTLHSWDEPNAHRSLPDLQPAWNAGVLERLQGHQRRVSRSRAAVRVTIACAARTRSLGRRTNNNSAHPNLAWLRYPNPAETNTPIQHKDSRSYEDCIGQFPPTG